MLKVAPWCLEKLGKAQEKGALPCAGTAGSMGRMLPTPGDQKPPEPITCGLVVANADPLEESANGDAFARALKSTNWRPLPKRPDFARCDVLEKVRNPSSDCALEIMGAISLATKHSSSKSLCIRAFGNVPSLDPEAEISLNAPPDRASGEVLC